MVIHQGFKLLILIAALAGSACTSVKHLDYEDEGARLPVFSVSAKVSESIHVELEHASLQGDRTEISVLEDERIELDDVQIDGPRDLRSDYELGITRFGMGIYVLSRESVQLKTGFGFSQTTLDLSFSDQLGGYDFDTDNPGAYGLFEARLPLPGPFAASARVGATKFFDDSSGYLFEQTLRLSASLGKTVELYTGWFNWAYENEDFWSEVDIEAKGLVYGVNLAF